MDDTVPNENKTSLHHRIYPYTTEVVQYAVDRGEGQPPWIVKNRSAATRSERQGRGRAVTRKWTPGEWVPVNKEEN